MAFLHFNHFKIELEKPWQAAILQEVVGSLSGWLSLPPLPSGRTSNSPVLRDRVLAVARLLLRLPVDHTWRNPTTYVVRSIPVHTGNTVRSFVPQCAYGTTGEVTPHK